MTKTVTLNVCINTSFENILFVSKCDDWQDKFAYHFLWQCVERKSNSYYFMPENCMWNFHIPNHTITWMGCEIFLRESMNLHWKLIIIYLWIYSSLWNHSIFIKAKMHFPVHRIYIISNSTPSNPIVWGKIVCNFFWFIMFNILSTERETWHIRWLEYVRLLINEMLDESSIFYLNFISLKKQCADSRFHLQ